MASALAGTATFALLRIEERDARTAQGDSATPVSVEVRSVRVLIGSAQERIRVESATPPAIDDATAEASLRKPADSQFECAADGGTILVDGRPTAGRVTIAPADDGPISVAMFRDGDWSEPREYPGRLLLTPSAQAGLTVINEVGVEPYVACVTANEVWPGFEEEAFRAQAIVARTYVLYQMGRRRNAPFDVIATQGSQVYRGLRRDTTGINASRATDYTRGLALTWFDGTSDRLFCSYYCAACGGRTQSAAIFGPESDINPLSGGIPCDYCRIAPGQTYRWEPVRLPLDEIYRRVVARDADMGSLESLRSIAIGKTTDDGRAITIRLTGANGATEEMLAERFRLALGGTEIRSTHFSIRQEGRDIVFADGQGFGHGLGLCQWGAEGQARQGRRAGAILRYYYPGAKLTRVY